MATDKAQGETVHDPLTKLITEGLFIDKTLLIKEFLKDEESHKTYILRPHGFGKSTLLDIIEAMYTDMDRLKGTKVYKEGFDESLPVIRIDMQKLIGAFPFPVKQDFNAKTAACVKNLKLLSSPTNKEKDDFGSALFAAFYEQIASGKQAINTSISTSAEHDDQKHADQDNDGLDPRSTSAALTDDQASSSSGAKHDSKAQSSAADSYEEELIASLEALSAQSAEIKSQQDKLQSDKSVSHDGDKSVSHTDENSAAYDGDKSAFHNGKSGANSADESVDGACYQSINELGTSESKTSYISNEHALKDGSFHSATKSKQQDNALEEQGIESISKQDALSDGGVALFDSISENFTYIPSQTSEKSSLFYIAHLLSRCEHRSRVLLIDNLDAPLLAAAYEPGLYNRRSQVLHYLFTILGTYAHVFRHIIITSTMPYESYGPGMRERNPNDLELDMKFSYSAKCAAMIGVSEQDLLAPQLESYMSKALAYMQAIHAKYKDKDLSAMHDEARTSFRHITLFMLQLFVSGSCPQSTQELASVLSSFYGNFSFDRMARTMPAISVVSFLRHPEYGFAPYRYGAAPLDVRYAFDISGGSIADFMQVLSNIFKGEERVLLENASLPNALRPNSIIDRIVKLQRNLYRLQELKDQIFKEKGKHYKGEEITLINERIVYIKERLNEIKQQMPTDRRVSKALAAKVLPKKHDTNSSGSVIYESVDGSDPADEQTAAKANGAADTKEIATQHKTRHKSLFAIIDDEDKLDDELNQSKDETAPRAKTFSQVNGSDNIAPLDEDSDNTELIEQRAAAAIANADLDAQEAEDADESLKKPSFPNASDTQETSAQDASKTQELSSQDASETKELSGQDASNTQDLSDAHARDTNSTASKATRANANTNELKASSDSDSSDEFIGVITDELADSKIDLIAPVRGRNGINIESQEDRELLRRMPLGMNLSHLMVAFGYLTTCHYENYELLTTMPNYESYVALKQAVLETLYAHTEYKRLPKLADNDTVFNGNLKAFLTQLRTVVHSFSFRRSDFVDSQAITACLNLYYAMNHSNAPSVATGANVPFLADSVSTTAKKAADRILKDDAEIQRKLQDCLGHNKDANTTASSGTASGASNNAAASAAAATQATDGSTNGAERSGRANNAKASTQDSSEEKTDDRTLKIELAANAKLEFYDACRIERALAKRAANGDANAAQMLVAAREDIKAFDLRAQEAIAAVDNPNIKAGDIILLSEERAKQRAQEATDDQGENTSSHAYNKYGTSAKSAKGESNSNLSKDEEILLAKEREAQAFADVIKSGHEVICTVVAEIDESQSSEAEEASDNETDDKSDMPVGYMSKQEQLAEEQEIKELLKKAYTNLKESGRVVVSDEQQAVMDKLINSIGVAYEQLNAIEERSDIAGASRQVNVPEDGEIETAQDRVAKRRRKAKSQAQQERSADDAIQLDALEQLGELVASGDNFAEYESEHDKAVKAIRATAFTPEQLLKSHEQYQKVLKVEQELADKSDNEKEAIVEEGVNTINELGNIIVQRLKRGADYAKNIDTSAIDNDANNQSHSPQDAAAKRSHDSSKSNALQQGNDNTSQQTNGNASQQNNDNAPTRSAGKSNAQQLSEGSATRQSEQNIANRYNESPYAIADDPELLEARANSVSTDPEEEYLAGLDEAHEAHQRSIAMSEKISNLREAITVLKDFADQISASRKKDAVAFDQSEALTTQDGQDSDSNQSNGTASSSSQGMQATQSSHKADMQPKSESVNANLAKQNDANYQKAVDYTAVALLKDYIKGETSNLREAIAEQDSDEQSQSVEVNEARANNSLKDADAAQASSVNQVNEYNNLTICRVRVQRGYAYDTAANQAAQMQTDAKQAQLSVGFNAAENVATENSTAQAKANTLASNPSALPESQANANHGASTKTSAPSTKTSAPSTGIAANSIRKCRNLGLTSEYEYVNLDREIKQQQEDVDAQFNIIEHARNDEERLIIDYTPFLGLRRQAKYLFENYESYELLYYELMRLKSLAEQTEQLSLVHYLDFMIDEIAHAIDVEAFSEMSKRQVEIEVFLERDRNPDWCKRGDLYSVIEDQVHLIVTSKTIKDKYFRLQHLADIATNQGLLFLSGWIWNYQQEYVKYSDQSAAALKEAQNKTAAQLQASAPSQASAHSQLASQPNAQPQQAPEQQSDASIANAQATTPEATVATTASENGSISKETSRADDNIIGLPSEIALAQDEAIAKANDRSQKAANMAISANSLRMVGVPGADFEFDDIYADEDLVEEFYDDYFESTFELILEAVFAIVGYKTHFDDENGLTYEDLDPIERQNCEEMKWVTQESIARIAKTWRILKAASVAGEPLKDGHLAFLSTIEVEYHLSQAVKYAITEARSNKPQEDIDIDSILKDAGLISASMFNARQEQLKERRRVKDLLVKSVVDALLKKRMPTMNLEAEFEHLNSLPLSVDKILNLRRYMMLARKYNRRDCFDKAATVLKRAIEKIDIEQPGALQERISSVKINSLNFSSKPIEHADDSRQQSLRKLDSQGLLGQLAVFSGPKTGKMHHSNFTVWNNDSAIILEIQTIKNLSEVQDAVKRAMGLIMTVNNPLAEVLGRSPELVANYKVRRIAVVALLTESGIKLVKAMNLDI